MEWSSYCAAHQSREYFAPSLIRERRWEVRDSDLITFLSGSNMFGMEKAAELMSRQKSFMDDEALLPSETETDGLLSADSGTTGCK